MLSTEIRRDDRGVDRCNRQIFTAVQKVAGDDSKGYKNVEAICGMPIIQRISDGVKGCPRCDKEPAVGNVHPRTTNASQTSLTPQELKECGLNPDGTRIDGKIIEQKSVEVAEIPVEGKVMEEGKAVSKNIIEIWTNVETLEQSNDIPAMLIKATVDAMDKLPVANYGESRRLDKVRQKLEALLAV
jgi:ribosomal protein L37AE/L43A